MFIILVEYPKGMQGARGVLGYSYIATPEKL